MQNKIPFTWPTIQQQIDHWEKVIPPEIQPKWRDIPAEALEQMKREGWPTMEEQRAYWENENQKMTDWFQEVHTMEPDDLVEWFNLRDEGRNPDGTGESYAERNL